MTIWNATARTLRGVVVPSLVFVSGGCNLPSSGVTTGADGLRTFSVIREVGGAPLLCHAARNLTPGAAVFSGQLGARDPVWITDAEGRQLHVIWPEGFSVRFEPEAVLYNDRGTAVAWTGERTELQGANRAAGTYDDPIIADWVLYDGCYPFVR